jgi:hypothetical protein
MTKRARRDDDDDANLHTPPPNPASAAAAAAIQPLPMPNSPPDSNSGDNGATVKVSVHAFGAVLESWDSLGRWPRDKARWIELRRLGASDAYCILKHTVDTAGDAERRGPIAADMWLSPFARALDDDAAAPHARRLVYRAGNAHVLLDFAARRIESRGGNVADIARACRFLSLVPCDE